MTFSIDTEETMRSEPLMGCSFLPPLGSDAILPAGVDLLTHIIKSWQTAFQNLKCLAFSGGNLYWYLKAFNEY